MASKPKDTTEEQQVPKIGLASTITLYATRFKQGGRTVYSLDLSLNQVTDLVDVPDPSQPTLGNRAIRPKHADDFAKYIRQREDWVMPGMILRAPGIFQFEVVTESEGVEFGVLSFPRRSMIDLQILDGQHRILGIFRAQRAIADDLEKARSLKSTARRQDPTGAGVRDADARIKALEKQRDRLETERVSIQIFVEEDLKAYRQMFYDISDNALGISASVRSRFDSRKVVNRALDEVGTHPLFMGRVDPEGDRTGRGSPFLLGAKHVAEIIRVIAVGFDGRVSKRQEDEFNEKDLAKKTKDFLSVMVEAFPPLRQIVLETLSPDELRKSSLLGSLLFFRVLAGVYYDLIVVHHWKEEDVEEFFSKLSQHVSAPAYEGDIWTTHIPDGIFQPGSYAPRGRRQDTSATKSTIVGWALDKAPFVAEAPAPRPAPPEFSEEDAEYGDSYTSPGYIDFSDPEAPVAMKA